MRVAKSTWWVTQCIFEMGSNLTQLLYCRFFQSCKDQMYFHIPIAVLFPVYSTFASSANILFFRSRWHLTRPDVTKIQIWRFALWQANSLQSYYLSIFMRIKGTGWIEAWQGAVWWDISLYIFVWYDMKFVISSILLPHCTLLESTY